MSQTLTIACRFHVDTRSRGRKQLQAGEPVRPPCAPGRVPRVSRLAGCDLSAACVAVFGWFLGKSATAVESAPSCCRFAAIMVDRRLTVMKRLPESS